MLILLIILTFILRKKQFPTQKFSFNFAIIFNLQNIFILKTQEDTLRNRNASCRYNNNSQQLVQIDMHKC